MSIFASTVVILVKMNLLKHTNTYLAYLGSIYVGLYNHVIWYLWYFQNSSLVNPMVYTILVNTIYTQPDPYSDEWRMRWVHFSIHERLYLSISLCSFLFLLFLIFDILIA